MTFPYKHVLLVGATAGIGKALAERLLDSGIKVSVVGRRKDRLEEFVQKYGPDKVQAFPFDLANVNEIPQFVQTVVAKAEIDCLFLNAGFQRVHNLANPSGFDLEQFNEQIQVNLTSLVTLTHAFLPYLLKRDVPGSIIFTTSNISIVPAVPMPAYSVSKAGLNAFVLCLREQLRDTNVKIIELSPPAVQSMFHCQLHPVSDADHQAELHDYMGEERGRALGMPLDEFTNEAMEGLFSGKDQIYVGSIGPKDKFSTIVDTRQEAFQGFTQLFQQMS